MNILSKAIITSALASIAALAVAERSIAQSYPDRPIHMIVPNAVGGGNDTVARLFAQVLSEELGQPVVVENIAGAAGVIGLNEAVNSNPDGYTLLASSSQMFATKYLQGGDAADPLSELDHISILAAAPLIAITNSQNGVDSYPEFRDLVGANPGSYRLGVSGMGGTIHLASELLKVREDLDIVTIPYTGGSAMVIDLISNQVQFGMLVQQVIQPYVEKGDLLPLFVASAERLEAYPEVPTSVELGIDGLENISNWFGLNAPKGVPIEVVETISEALAKVINNENLQSRLKNLGFVGIVESPAEFSERMARSDAAFAAAVSEGNISLQ